MLRANSQLRFHSVHGKLIEVDGTRTKASRSLSYFDGITLSDRPIIPWEQVRFRILETKENIRHYSIKFGFTPRDPNEIGNALPIRAPTVINENTVFWTMEWSTYCKVKGKVLSFYFTPTGSVHYVCEGVGRGEFIIPSERQSLWAVVDLFGTCTAVRFLNVRAIKPTQKLQPNQPIPQSPSCKVQIDDDCKICCERAMNAVLIDCGHLMCYDCADKLKRAKFPCPFCRAEIKGILRIYKP